MPTDHHDDLVAYPTTLPSAALIGIVMDALKYRQVDVKHAVHGAYHLVGFGLGKWDTHEMGKTLQAPAQAISEADAADLLAPLAAKGEGEATGEDRIEMAVGMPWGLLIPILMELIKRLLNG